MFYPAIPTSLLRGGNLRLIGCLCLLFAPPAFSQQPASAPARVQQKAEDARPLELGKPIERELAGGQSHSYQITLTNTHTHLKTHDQIRDQNMKKALEYLILGLLCYQTRELF